MSASGKASHSGFRLGTSDKSRFQEAAGRNRTSEMGSLSECRLLAGKPVEAAGRVLGSRISPAHDRSWVVFGRGNGFS